MEYRIVKYITLFLAFYSLPLSAEDLKCCQPGILEESCQFCDYGFDECGQPCYPGGCPKCLKTELKKSCKKALDDYDEYMRQPFSTADWANVLLREAEIKCSLFDKEKSE